MWAVVTLLAVAGFAAFQTGGRDAPVALDATRGRQVGALAGLGFHAPKLNVATPISATPLSSEPVDLAALTTAPSAPAEAPVDTLPTNGWLSEMQVRALVSKYFQAQDVNRAIRVIWCESRFNPTSSNSETGGAGLFHHLPEFWPTRSEAAGFAGAEATDPEANVAAAAYAVYEEGGWSVFNCIP